MRFGKHPPKVDYRTLRFQNYLTDAIAPPPSSYNVLTRVYQNLGTADPAQLFPMDGNDTLEDCTIAALARAVTAYRGLVKSKDIMAKQAVVKLYFHLTGGQDTGLNELDVLFRQGKYREFSSNRGSVRVNRDKNDRYISALRANSLRMRTGN
jgi:hypothetical protein